VRPGLLFLVARAFRTKQASQAEIAPCASEQEFPVISVAQKMRELTRRRVSKATLTATKKPGEHSGLLT
jgi:hypothetical protein